MKKKFGYDEDIDELDDEYDDDDDDEFDFDDAEEESVSDKLKRLKAKTEGVALFSLIIGAIGLLSIIFALFAGGGLSPNEDPMDYYGTYYSVSDEQYITFYIEEDEWYTVTSDGTGMLTERVDYISIKYVSASEAQKISPNSKYDDCPALILYEDSDFGVTLWITENDPEYEFVIDKTDAKVTTEEFDFKKDMGDPEDYYYTYEFNEDNYVTFKKDGTAEFSLNGKMEKYSFAFVNGDWLAKWMNKTGIKYALVLYKEGGKSIQTFEYKKGSDELSYGGNIFEKVSSSGSSSSGSSSSSGNSGSSSSSGNSGSATIDWEELLDVSNITIVIEKQYEDEGVETILSIYIDEENNEWMAIDILIGEGYDEELIFYYSDHLSECYDVKLNERESLDSETTQYNLRVIESYQDKISQIDVSTLEKTASNVYENSSVEITLGSSGKIKSIYFIDDDITLEISNQGTTVVNYRYE